MTKHEENWHPFIGKYISPDKNKVILIYGGPGSKIGIANAAYYVDETNKEANTNQRIGVSYEGAKKMVETMRDNQWTRSNNHISNHEYNIKEFLGD